MAEDFTYDDFAIGQTFQSRSIVIERHRIISFGEEFDPRPQHLGEQAAVSSQFGELVASGWHTGAVSMRLYTEAVPRIEGGGQGAGLEGLAWPNPVRPDDAIRVEIEIVEKRESRSRPDRAIVKLHAVTRNQRDEIVQQVTHVVIVPRR
jgi:acyl dehydratase